MDDSSRSALALVFIRGGTLPSPLSITPEEDHAIARLGGTVGDAMKGLESLNGSLLLNSKKEGNYYWHFKHPTIRDAFASIVASNQDLMDIYLTGAPLDKLFSEISCGDVGVQGVSVIVPASQYNIIIEKIKLLDTKKWFNKLSLYRFLSYRCDKFFLRKYMDEFPNFISQLSVSSYIYANSEVDVLLRLHEFDLLPEAKRINAISSIKNLAVIIPDSGFLRNNIKALMSSDEISDILRYVQCTLLPNLDDTIDSWKNDYNREEEPEAYFEELKSALDDYKSEFEEDAESLKQINEAIKTIDQVVEDLRSEYTPSDDINFWNKRGTTSPTLSDSRSIFDDVDA